VTASEVTASEVTASEVSTVVVANIPEDNPHSRLLRKPR
jgi:hypothetical protein